MSIKQTEHLNHYVNALTEDEDISGGIHEDKQNVTEVEEDDKTTFKQFYESVDQFKLQFPPTFTCNDYKSLMSSEEFKVERDELIQDFIKDFDPNSSDPRMLDVLIVLSSIGLEIPKQSALTTLVDNLNLEE